ncbi:hypothetical protein BJ912DRAFT_981752, partial [Pholiota molesta]
MLGKAREAHLYYKEKGKFAPSQSPSVDDLLYFGGNNTVVQRELTGTAPNLSEPSCPPPQRPQSLSAPSITPSHSLSLDHGVHHIPSASSIPIPPKPLHPATSIRPPPLTYPITAPLNLNTALPPLSHLSRQQQKQKQPQVVASASQSSSTSRAQSFLPSLLAPYETFADLSGGWSGLFHEVPSHAPAYGLQHHHRSSATDTTNPGMHHDGHDDQHAAAREPAHGSLGAPHQLYQQQYSLPTGTNGQPEGVMLDDRWASFMNYGVMGERLDRSHDPPYQSQSQSLQYHPHQPLLGTHRH